MRRALRRAGCDGGRNLSGFSSTMVFSAMEAEDEKGRTGEGRRCFLENRIRHRRGRSCSASLDSMDRQGGLRSDVTVRRDGMIFEHGLKSGEELFELCSSIKSFPVHCLSGDSSPGLKLVPTRHGRYLVSVLGN